MSVDTFREDFNSELAQYDIRAIDSYRYHNLFESDTVLNDIKNSDDSMDDIKNSDDSMEEIKENAIKINCCLDYIKTSDKSINSTDVIKTNYRLEDINTNSTDVIKANDKPPNSMDDIKTNYRLVKNCYSDDIKSSDKSPTKLKLINDITSDIKNGMWYKGMYINNFDIYKITTTTIIVELNKSNNEKVAFHLLPITKMLMSKKCKSAKCELPFCDIPGSIIALKHYDQVRGIVKSEKNGFKHAISIDISTSTKNINVQLSSLKMKITGSNSEDGKLGREAAQLVIEHIEHIQSIINKIKSNKDIAEKTIAWVIKHTRGEKIIRERQVQHGKLIINSQFEDFTIMYPMYFVPDELDMDIAKFLISLINDYVYHSDMCVKITSMLNVPNIINEINDEPLKIQSMDFAMVNYNYHLFFNINLESLDQCIHGKNNFYSHYNNDLSNCVTVELAYDASINPAIKRKKNKVPRITFLCYKSGSVTLSGCGGFLMAESYYLFMITIAEIKHLIIAD